MTSLRRFELGAILGEQPVWCPIRRCLWLVDIRAPAVLRLDPADGRFKRFPTSDLTGMIALARQALLIAIGRQVVRFDPATGRPGEMIAELDASLDGNRINDSKVGPDGCLWCGTMRDGGGAPVGSLYHIAAGAEPVCLASGITTPNALCFSPDGGTIYFADTPKGAILKADRHQSPLRFEPFAAADVAPGLPDGATIDAEGYLWNARVGGSCIARIDPTGRLDRLIELPVSQPTACAFGGDDLATLFVTSARQRLTGEQRAAQPFAGDVFAVGAGVGGLAEYRFDG